MIGKKPVMLFIALILCSYINGAATDTLPCQQLLPVDESKSDKSFLQFRSKLGQAIKDKDSSFIFSVMDRDVQVCFGGNECVGKKAFKNEWYDRHEGQGFWREIYEAMALGCTKGEQAESFSCPYVFKNFPDDLDPFMYLAVLGKNIPIYRDTLSGSRPIATLSYCLVKDSTGGSERWLELDGDLKGKGFVERKHLRSAVDVRVGFQKKHGKWMIVFFIAGD